MNEDAELLRRYALEGCQDAFTELVNRHLGMVYSAACRQTGGRHDLAKDVSQAVFSAMAAKARSLIGHEALVGWLFLTTRHIAIDAIRKQRRHELRMKEAQEMNAANEDGDHHVPWEHVQPVLDEAVQQLGERDRNAILLRFFEGRSFAQVGACLSLTENAARMRVERALTKLRLLLAKRGISSSAAALGLVLTEHACGAAPIGLATGIAGTALAATSSAPAGALLGYILMTKIKVALLVGLAAAVTTAAILWFAPYWSKPVIVMMRQDADRLRHSVEDSRQKAGPAGKGDHYLKGLASRVRENSAKVVENAVPAETAEETLKFDLSVPYRNLGQQTPSAAAMTFAWASDCGDLETLSKLIYFSAKGRAKAEELLNRLPEEARAEWSSPERIYALLIAGDALDYPPPPADGIQKAVAVFLAADRVWMGPPGKTPQTARGQEFQLTQEGWKYAFPDFAIEGFANQLLRANEPAKVPAPNVSPGT